MSHPSGSWLELSRGALRHNVGAIRAAVAPSPVIAVVKADAYGHGLPGMAAVLAEAGVARFAVAYPEEAATVRQAVPGAELVFLLGRARAADVPLLREAGVTPAIVDLDHARELSEAALAGGAGPLDAHLKIDTGMGRLGFVWPARRDDALAALRLPGLRVTGLCTHFAKVEPETDPAWAAGQAARFSDAAAVLEAAAGRPLFQHCSATRAALLLPEQDRSAVRVGISLYGYETDFPGARFATRPVLSWKTRVLQVKEVPAGFHAGYDGTWTAPRPTALATLSVGYADGYRRSWGNRARVVLGGRMCPVAGRVSMNWLIVDAGPGAAVRPGDVSTLLGGEPPLRVDAAELAALDNTISYEVLTGLSRQLPRIWTN